MPDLLHGVLEWIPKQRWFAGKGRRPELSVVHQQESSLRPGIHLLELLVQDGDASGSPYYVPLTVHAAPAHSFQHALIDSDTPGVFAYDAPHDPAFADHLLRAVIDSGLASSSVDLASTVLTGEQSNTSILYWTESAPSEAPADTIVKVFRRLEDGDNPDVVLQSALSEAGSPRVPRARGHAWFQWTDPVGLVRRSHVAFAQEFVDGAEDAWRVLLRALRDGTPLESELERLGSATAEIHRDLAGLFPTDPPTPERIAAIVQTLRHRAQAAIGAVPALEQHRDSIEQHYAVLPFVSWSALQRIHGDFHLGQVLRAPDRGWLIVDFEGEPLRPLAERRGNDVPLRDVAGMLRSLDYVAAASERDSHAVDPAWTTRARNAFLNGYSAASAQPLDPQDPVLRALELDKALYEVLYETGNRPDWVSIPLAAVERLVSEPVTSRGTPRRTLRILIA